MMNPDVRGKGPLRALVAVLMAWMLFAVAAPAAAQAPPSPTHFELEVGEEGLKGSWRVLLSELEGPLALDSNGDGDPSWPEIEHRQQEIQDFLGANLQVVANGAPAALRFEQLLYGTQVGRPAILASLAFDSIPDISKLEIDLGRFAGTTVIRWPGGARQSASVDAGAGAHSFRKPEDAGGFPHFLWQGVWHIWIGFDHILFLLVLLLPAVYRRTDGGREVVGAFGTALAQVLAIVTSFTVAHSITLTCAAMGWIELPGRLVESAIAASVFLAAVANFLPRAAGGRGAWIAFLFGLLHGFGFAGALGEIAPAAGRVWQSLLAFNLGVELGQLAIVAAFLPLAFLLRRTSFYRLGALYTGSALAAMVALRWFVQRAFAL